MKFYYAIEKRKFDKAWAKLAKAYEEAGMEPEAIQAMYEFDWGVFKAARVEALHTQEFTIPESTDDDLSECESPLFEKFQDRLSSEYDTLGGHSRYWWIDELSSPCLAFGAAILSEDDMLPTNPMLRTVLLPTLRRSGTRCKSWNGTPSTSRSSIRACLILDSHPPR